jgi:hypothetical protein
MLASPDSSRRSQTTPSNSSTSFAQQLADALEGYLNEAQPGSRLEIDITPQVGQNSGSRQFLITVKDDSLPPAPVAAAPVAPAAASASAPAPQTAPPSTPQYTNQKDAYWGHQPEAVRVLRDIPDIPSRLAKGFELARQGYAIDTDIMVYHNDPWKTMSNRSIAGYAWVPGLGQPPVLHPGASFPGMRSYDPHNQPPGSVTVDMDIFRGLEHTSIWWFDDIPVG